MNRHGQVGDGADRLLAECTLLTRYLVGRAVPPLVAPRYARAHKYVLPADPDRIVSWVLRHPWALPYLDAACGLKAPDGLLRRKLLVLTAILETTPELADAFLPEPVSRLRFVIRAARHGAAACWKGAVGRLLFSWLHG